MKKIFYVVVLMSFFAVVGDCLAQPANYVMPGSDKMNIKVTPVTDVPQEIRNGASYYSMPKNLPFVEIQKASIVDQKDNNIKISFDIKNGDKIQPEVRYAVKLMKNYERGQFLIDTTVYDEFLTLENNANLHKEIAYQAPGYLSGDYELGLIVSTSNGNQLGFSSLGEIKLKKTSDYVEIVSGSCYLNIEGDNSNVKYYPEQGVDISSSEDLVATCKLKNNFPKTVNVTPNFETFYRSMFGESVAKNIETGFSMGANEEKEIKLKLPKAKVAQAYDILLKFTDNNGLVVSNGARFHYVLQGKGATIQSILFDKISYVKSDIAKVSIYYTLSADSFPDSRNKGSMMDTVNIEMSMKNVSGNSCANAVEKTVDGKEIMKVIELEIPVEKDCSEPQIELAIKDSTGQVLASENYELGKSGSGKSGDSEKVNRDKNDKRYLMLVFLVTAIMIVMIIFWYKRKKSISLVFFAIIISSCLFATGTVQAGSAQFSFGEGWCYAGNTNTWHNIKPGWYAIWIPDKVLSGSPFTAAVSPVLASICNNGIVQNTSVNDKATRTPIAWYWWTPTWGLDQKNGTRNYVADVVSTNTVKTIEFTGVTARSYLEQWYQPINCQWMEYVKPLSMQYTICASVAATCCAGTPCLNSCMGVNYYETGTKYCPPVCVPTNSACAATTCNTATCWDGCSNIQGTKNCPSCTPDSTCTSHAISWGSCSGACGGTGTRTGTCDNGCGGTGSKTDNTCSTAPCCTCSSSENANNCIGSYTNSCGMTCTGTKDCSEPKWKEVAP